MFLTISDNGIKSDGAVHIWTADMFSKWRKACALSRPAGLYVGLVSCSCDAQAPGLDALWLLKFLLLMEKILKHYSLI